MTPEDIDLRRLRRQLSRRFNDEIRKALLKNDKDILDLV
jgi:hypothetical protein